MQTPYVSHFLFSFSSVHIVGGIRPPIPANCLGSLRYLMEACWQKEPGKRFVMPSNYRCEITRIYVYSMLICLWGWNRPSFSQILPMLDIVMVDATVNDECARDIWKKNFLGKARLCSIPAESCNILSCGLTQSFGLAGGSGLGRFSACAEGCSGSCPCRSWRHSN